MPRNMSFSMTTQQVRGRFKTVTRRLGWWFLKPGDIVNAVEKAQGLKKGEKIKRICPIRILTTRGEPLSAIDENDVEKEGFWGWSVEEFIDAFCESQKKCTPETKVNRIEFEYPAL